MKLPLRHKYFEEIKAGVKTVDFRDAHITFIDEETGEELRRDVSHTDVVCRKKDLYPDVLTEEYVIRFFLLRPRESVGGSE